MNVVSFLKGHQEEQPPANELDNLHAERARVDGELRRYAVVDERLRDTERKLAEIDAGIAACNRADRDAAERFASGADSELAPPLLDERKRLLARRLDAEAERQAALIAVDAVGAKRTALNQHLAAIWLKFRERKVAAAVVEARAIHAEVVKAATEIGEKIMRIEALRQTLGDGLSGAVNGKNDAEAAIFHAAMNDVAGMRPPEVLGHKPTVDKYAAAWLEEIS